VTTPVFCYLASPDKGVATIEDAGRRFLPLFIRPQELEAFHLRGGDQLSDYRFYLVSEPADVTAFLDMVRGLSLQVGIAQDVPKGTGESTFVVMEPDVLARALAASTAGGPTPEGRNAPRTPITADDTRRGE
jgi:hypothetical protein